MRIVFMGSPDFSVLALKNIIDAGHDVVAVYAQPPREKGRGHSVQKNPVHIFGESLDIPVFTPLTLRTPESQEIFKSHQADIAVVAAYGLILPKEILEAPRYGCLNIHASVLPRWRGAAPIQRAIMAGDTVTGITIMQMDIGLDTGNMLHIKKIPITPQSTGKSLHDELSVLGADMIVDVLSDYEKFKASEKVQPLEGVTYATKLLKEDGNLDLSHSATTLDREIRGLSPFVSCWIMLNNVRYKIIEATPSEECIRFEFEVADSILKLRCGPTDSSTTLCITKIQREGGKPMTIEDYLKGNTF